MENTDTAIRILREDYLHHTKKAAQLKNALVALGENPDAQAAEKPAGITMNSNDGYDPNMSLVEKCSYYDNVVGRIWTVRDFVKFVKEKEPDTDIATFKSGVHTRLRREVVNGAIVRITFGMAITFHTTRKEWIITDESRKRIIDPAHMPEAKVLAKLSAEQLSPENIEWEGI